MKLLLIALALLLVLLIILIYIYMQESEPESVTFTTPQYVPQVQRRIYAYTPIIDIPLPQPAITQPLNPKRRKRKKRRTFESSEESTSTESSEITSEEFSSETWDDTFDEHEEIVIVEGPEELRHLVDLVQRDIMNGIDAMNMQPMGPPIFQPAGLRRHRNRAEETPEEFFQEMNDHNDDGQNVHNAQIRKAITDRLLRIIELNGGYREMYEVGGLELSNDQYFQAKFNQTEREIRERSKQYHDGLVLREEINREEADLRNQKIDMVLKKIEHGYDILMTDHKTYKENFILVNVWDRINHRDNFAHREQLQIALIDQLVDSVEERQAPVAAIEEFINTVLGTNHQPEGLEQTHMTVCINGRVSRVLSSLVLLDADEQIATPEKDEKEYMNEALYKAARLVDRELELYEVKLPEYNNSPDVKKTMRELYEEPDEDKLSQREQLVVKNFETHLREVMSEEIHKDYDGVLSPDQVAGIIEKAHAGI
jgi:hypothetical protein